MSSGLTDNRYGHLLLGKYYTSTELSQKVLGYCGHKLDEKGMSSGCFVLSRVIYDFPSVGENWVLYTDKVAFGR